MRTLAISLILVLLGSWISAQTNVGSPAQAVYTNLNFPDAFAFAPDGRIFFNEKTGVVRVIQNGIVQMQPFATLEVVSSGEQGLLGLALHPNFSQNGFLYVFYTYTNGTAYHSRIRRFTAVGNLGISPTDIFDIIHPSSATNHNGGYIKFGPDGKLYVQVGENAVANLSQDLSSYSGKILRMNDDGSVPADNPFKGSLVYAYGIRNAFGMDFDPNTHMLISTEAGPDRDEINIITAGANYGWPACVGPCNNPQYKDPIVTFNPATTPTGIAYASPNTFYFGEWTAADLKRLELTPEGKVASVEYAFSPGGGVVAVERGPDGNIYFSTPNAIYLYTPNAQQPPKATVTNTITTTPTNVGQALALPDIWTMIAVALGGLFLAGWLSYRRKSNKSRKSEHARH